MSKSPKIGVTTSKIGGLYMWCFYWLALRMYGIRPQRLIAPVDEHKLSNLDGLIVGGGDDISAKLYEGKPEIDVRIDPERDLLEQKALEIAIKRDIPILGICRGSQMLNVFLGGNLHQDIYQTFENVPQMRTPLPRKRVFLEEGSKLLAIIQMKDFKANSLHHQSINELGKGLTVSARDQWGIVQAIEDKSADFRIGVQWHPEFLIFKSSQRRLFKAFIQAVCQRLERI